MAALAPAKTEEQTPVAVPLEERISQRAYEIYLERGGRDGSDLDDWLQAEAEIAQAEKI